MQPAQLSAEQKVSEINDGRIDLLSAAVFETRPEQNILGTALFRLKDEKGRVSLQIRGMCDSGSQINLISKECVQRLNLPQTSSHCTILGAGIGSEVVSSTSIEGVLCHGTLPETFGTVRFHIVPKISCNQPQSRIDCDVSTYFAEYQLADQYFGTPARMDAIIGVGTWASVIRGGIVRLAAVKDSLIAQNSVLGWIVCGTWPTESVRTYQSYHISLQVKQDDLNLERFWEVDEGPAGHVITKDDAMAESNFVATHRFCNGRYVVTIPMIPNAPSLGASKHIALKRMLALEARMCKDVDLAIQCKEFFQDYLQAGHMIPAPPVPSEFGHPYYIPYHAIRAKKFRVVFDGSCRTSTGVSVNDLQLAGPKLQADLSKTLLSFRMHRFAITADIVKMFRQVQIDEQHWNYQRVLWRLDKHQPVQEFVLTCVVWGFTSATFNAVRALRQCAMDNRERFPLASEVALSCFYVDDLSAGADNYDQLVKLRNEMTSMLGTGGFPIAKWTTSHPRLAIELGQSATQEISINDETGVLGMSWEPRLDVFRLNLNNYDHQFPERMTKRQVISRIAKVYDPSGLFAPIIVHGKMIIQDIWRLKIDWDQLVPVEIMERWQQFHGSIVQLATITVPRWIVFASNLKSEWHVFCDASESAYGACVYLRTEDGCDNVSSHLVVSRSRVAPVKKVTIPRLELLGAVMAVELWAYVSDACHLGHVPVWFWTDSMIVLHWLAKDSRSLKPFVANRVSSILKLSELRQWQHIPGEDNPADLVSRGSTVAMLQASKIWWNGPSRLCQPTNQWPVQATLELSDRERNEDRVEAKATFAGAITISPTTCLQINNAAGESQTLLARASSLHGLVRATAFVQRFIDVLKKSRERRLNASAPLVKSGDIPALSVIERQAALNYWINYEQRVAFRREAQALQSQIPLPSTAKLSRLCPFLDSEDIMRVGGRLQNAQLNDNMKHPVLIPASSALALLIIRDAHRQALHGAVQLTMVVVRQNYWITGLRALTRKVIGRCTSCIRYRKEVASQLMANLPSARVMPTLTFVTTGLDFAGPFMTRRTAGRPPRNIGYKDPPPPPPTVDKLWVAVFVCMTTHAIHLDLTYGLSVEAFLETFARFTARRGHCRELWSDNGTTFVGTNKELQRVLAEWGHKLPDEELANYGTTWRFITPGAPHQGGIWEAGVKAFKHHLRRTVGEHKLTPNQLYTVLTKIEACLNSRPIVPMSDDPSDLQVLTPGHFIAGRPLLQRPLADDVENLPDNRLTSWGRSQRLMQTFWRRWKDEHLVALQTRTKWHEACENLRINDLVILLDENTAPARWPIARVVMLHPGEDHLVRNVTVWTGSGHFKRPVQKLVKLYRDPDDDAQVDARLLPGA